MMLLPLSCLKLARCPESSRLFPSLLASLTLIINLTIIIYTIWSHDIILPARGEPQQRILPNKSELALTARNATNPLIYKRLRFDDNYLQLYRRFQKNLPIDEKKITFKVNETQADNKTKLVEYSYYENNQIESTNFTDDDIIFEALDRTYLTRLNAFYIYSYDNKRDLVDASDPKLVSPKRCNKEMDFLMRQLDIIQSIRRDGVTSGHMKLSNERSMELMALFDSFGMEEPGLLMGNYLWSGNWRQCQKSLVFHRNLTDPASSVEFKSRYCIASLRSKRWDKLVASRIPELERHFKYPEQKYEYAKFHRLQIGICIPESCDSTVIGRRRQDIHRLVVHKLSEPLKSYDLFDLYCLPDETSKLREVEPSGRIFLLVITIWLAMIISATIYDHRTILAVMAVSPASGVQSSPKSSPTRPAKPTGLLEKMVDSMSLIKNLDRLLETRSCQPAPPLKQQAVPAMPDGKQHQGGKVKLVSERNKPTVNDLLFLNFIKILPMPIIIFGHGGMMYKLLDRFPLDYDCINRIVAHFHFSAVFFVDYYFVISGFLTAYVAFVSRRVERNNLAAWVHTIVHRYLRLAPLYVLLFWFAKSTFIYTSNGPIWDYGSSNMTFRSVCRRESYIWPLTLTSNLHPIHEECIMPSWYISCDFQFYLITPFVLLLLHKAPLAGWLASLGTIGACIALRGHRYLTDSRAQSLDLMRPRYDLYMRNNWDMHATYIYPHYRIASYLIGLLAGHYAYMVLSGQWQSAMFYDRATRSSSAYTSSSRGEAQVKRRKNWLRFSAWSFSVCVSITMMFITGVISYSFPQALEPYARYVSVSTYSISHSGASFSLSIFIITLMFGQFGWLKRFMALPVWTVLSRINFIIFLTQIEVIYWMTLSTDRLTELNNIELFRGFFYLSAILYPLAAILTLLFELPIAQLERNFIAPLFHSPSPSTSLPGSQLPPSPISSPQPTRRNNTAATGCAPGRQGGAACEMKPMITSAGGGNKKQVASTKS